MKRRTFCASVLAVATASAFAQGRTPSRPVTAARNTGGEATLSVRDVDDLRRALRGALLARDDEGYDEARRIWNGAIDRRPALIARCVGAADVAQAVSFARAHDLVLAVRGGGHSFSGQSVCDGGLMIDLSRMRGIRVDPVARIARVEPGVLLGELDREAQFFGLATPAGTVSHTGAAGLTLGGGFGRIARRFGLACDNLRAADVVTADGRFVRASEQENPDLLWGLRGGGGNFGIVTSFEYQLHGVEPMMYGGNLLFPFEQARPVLKRFADFIDGAPDELYADAALAQVPDIGRVLAFNICYSGPPDRADAVLKPLRQFGKPLVDALGPATYVTLQSAADGQWSHGKGYYERSGFLKRIEPALIDVAVGRMEGRIPPGAAIAIPHQGGAISRVPRTATAFWHRDAGRTVISHAHWEDPKDEAAAETHLQWARETFRALEPHTNGFYVNTMAVEDSAQRVRATYGDNFARLVALKQKYDPTNLLRRNANIPPA
jgi:FAD/FMN-containing dehydrogenase